MSDRVFYVDWEINNLCGRRWYNYRNGTRVERRVGLKQAQREANQQWHRLVAGDHHQLMIGMLKPAIDADTTVRQQSQEIANTRQAILQMPTGGADETDYFEACMSLWHRYQEFLPDVQQCHDNWDAVRLIYGLVQGGVNQRSLDAVQRRIDWATQTLTIYDLDQQDMETRWRGQPDANGRFRIPMELALRHNEEWHIQERLEGAEIDRRNLHATQDNHIENLQDQQPAAGEREWQLRNLGAGVGGEAIVCIRVDEYNGIDDRIVRKENYMDKNGEGRWHSVLAWASGDVSSDTDKMPWELECLRFMSAKQHLRNVIKLRGPTDRDAILQWIYPDMKAYRVFTEFYPHGDLEQIIKHYAARQRTLPESFIWNVAEALVECGLEMEDFRPVVDDAENLLGFNGQHNNVPADFPMDHQIIHRDLKPANVFLGVTQGPNHYPMYPTPVVGDFGGAILTSNGDTRNPEVWVKEGAAMPGFRPPEMIEYFDHDTMEDISAGRLWEYTNVWQVGQILRCLILTESQPAQLYWLNGENDAYTVTGKVAGYSQELLELVDDCMRYHDYDRPTFRALRQRIQDCVGAGPGQRDLTNGDRLGNVQHLVHLEDRRVLIDKYRLGMTGEQMLQRGL